MKNFENKNKFNNYKQNQLNQLTQIFDNTFKSVDKNYNNINMGKNFISSTVDNLDKILSISCKIAPLYFTSSYP